MSNTTPATPRGTDATDAAATDGSRFTVEDAGSTTDPTDLFDNDTTASGTAVDSGRTDTAGEVASAAAASGPGTQADGASSTSDASGAVRSAGSPAAVPVDGSGSGPAVDAVAPAKQDVGSHDHADHDHAGHDHADHDHADHAGHDHDHADHDHADHDHAGHDHAAHAATGPDGDTSRQAAPKPPVDDESIGHVFDQTNGVIDGIEGDTNGFAEDDATA